MRARIQRSPLTHRKSVWEVPTLLSSWGKSGSTSAICQKFSGKPLEPQCLDRQKVDAVPNFRGPSTSILGISGLLKTVIACFLQKWLSGSHGLVQVGCWVTHENLPRVNHQSETKSIDIETETTSLKKYRHTHENSHLPQKRDRPFYIPGKYHLPTINFPRVIFLRFAGWFSCRLHGCLGRFQSRSKAQKHCWHHLRCP